MSNETGTDRTYGVFVQCEDIHLDEYVQLGPFEAVRFGDNEILVDHGNGWDNTPAAYRIVGDGPTDPDGEPYSWLDHRGRNWHNVYIVGSSRASTAEVAS